MKRIFVDTDEIATRKMAKDGNIDFQYWFDKSIEERLSAAVSMIEVSYKTTNFIYQKVDRNIFSSSKKSSSSEHT